MDQNQVNAMQNKVMLLLNVSRDLQTRATSTQENMKAPAERLRRGVDRLKWQDAKDIYYANLQANLKATGVQINDEDKRNLEEFLSHRIPVERIVEVISQAAAEIDAVYRGFIFVRNATVKVASGIQEIALPIAQMQAKQDLFKPSLLGLSPDVTKASPQGAERVAERAEEAASLQNAPVAADNIGPSL